MIARLTSSVYYFSCEVCLVLRHFEKFGRTNGRTTHVKMIITPGRDYGSAEWIKNMILVTECIGKNILEMSTVLRGSPGHGRIGGHYVHAWCPYVRPSHKANFKARKK